MVQGIIAKILTDLDGGTMSLRESMSVPSYGYMVGGAGPVLVLRDSLGVDESRFLVESYLSHVRIQGHGFVGWWTDRETGKFYLDCSTWHESVTDADRASTERKEIAFYDLGNDREMRTGSTRTL